MDAAAPSPLRRRAALLAVAIAALALPWALQTLGASYYTSMAGRIVVYAIAATSLNLVLGYGGMVSFGHAAFVGLGAYVTGVMISEGVLDGGAHLLATLLVSGVAAALIGAISLRTRGVYFIMITLAFAQMLFYLANSIKGYGGDEGLNIRARSAIGLQLDLKNATTFYYVALAVLAACLWALARFVPSRLGRAVLAIRDDEQRAEALGFATFRLRWLVFVVAGMVAGIAGALSVNQQGYVSPNVLHWTQSGTLMVMVILGGVATLWGGVLGAAALLLLQEVLSAYTSHWEFWTGWVLLAVVLFARRGLAGVWRGLTAR
ncbi:MAG TPA: branched-chain amino acid ABC transporter permease [Burkholderiaceae bacterium]|nr:branched-chain amino acid ABC transporter permease [Burkholderiaceae bacterium]